MQKQTHYSRVKTSQISLIVTLAALLNIIFLAWYPVKRVKFNPNAIKDKKYLEKTHQEITKEIDKIDKQDGKKTSTKKKTHKRKIRYYFKSAV